MEAQEVLDIVLREMVAIGEGWRCDWGGFDGRSLRSQLNSIAKWADSAIGTTEPTDYTIGSNFLEDQSNGY